MSAEREPGLPRLRIVDVVFSAQRSPRRVLVLLALLLAVGAHAALFLSASRSEQSLQSWSAQLALRVHAELSREELIAVTKPPPPPPPPKAEPPLPAQTPPPQRALARAPLERRSAPPPPAQAGAILAREPDPNAPVDLTSDTFVTGTASAYAGGVTSARGTNTHAVHEQPSAALPVRPIVAAPRGPDRSSAVTLEEQEWNCPWPNEAEDQTSDEQRVVLRVVVAADGRAESARIEQEPGHGFGAAAIRCALRTRFTPAHDREGRAIKAASPTIRVRFTR